ncbi:DUF3304 domain-containing protein [Massilia sp. TW-1]|uniref:DUF3304 domain-containing protein n=1 Tax=Telluria antibiotica TaxID=2717319 RepID=A0ABX0P7X2_9BURK|nr:DUF3304 domain-containing protein [Telluria antibiotica]NIA53112.1 DUF3304 domain-containing protein [Telluria antibiotica]
MKIPIPNFLRWYPVMSLLLAGILVALFMFLYDYLKVNYFKVETHIPVFSIGVHHMGSDYRIPDFYVNKYSAGSVGESGGGGGMVCCFMLPKKWYPGLKADVRWELRHITRESSGSGAKTEEVAGFYRAQVPVEAYAKPGDFYVHFFPGGRVRIVVSEFSITGKEHPIQGDDPLASQTATPGSPIKSLFTAEELAEFEREFARDKAKYGDWR